MIGVVIARGDGRRGDVGEAHPDLDVALGQIIVPARSRSAGGDELAAQTSQRVGAKRRPMTGSAKSGSSETGGIRPAFRCTHTRYARYFLPVGHF